MVYNRRENGRVKKKELKTRGLLKRVSTFGGGVDRRRTSLGARPPGSMNWRETSAKRKKKRAEGGAERPAEGPLSGFGRRRAQTEEAGPEKSIRGLPI